MADRIEVRDLLLRAIIGITEEERVKPQDVVIHLVLWADTRAAAASDDIADAVNYRTVSKQVSELVEASEGRGAAARKRDEIRRMAAANKAFSHYRF